LSGGAGSIKENRLFVHMDKPCLGSDPADEGSSKKDGKESSWLHKYRTAGPYRAE